MAIARMHLGGYAGRMPALRAPLGVAAMAAAAVTFVGVVDPNEPGHYPTCPVLALTGLFCPGCGSLRAVHAMTHGDFAAAVGLNVLTVVASAAFIVIWLHWLMRRWTGRTPRRVAPAPVLWALLAFVLVFGVVRNLPMGAALAP